MYRAGKKDADYNVQTRYGRQRQQHIDERLRCLHVSVNKITDFFFFFFFFARIILILSLFVCVFVRNDDNAIDIDYNCFYYN